MSDNAGPSRLHNIVPVIYIYKTATSHGWLTLNKLGLWLASCRLVRSVLLDKCQGVSSAVCNKVSRGLAIFAELGCWRNIGLMLILSSTLSWITASQLFFLLLLSCNWISRDLLIN